MFLEQLESRRVFADVTYLGEGVYQVMGTSANDFLNVWTDNTDGSLYVDDALSFPMWYPDCTDVMVNGGDGDDEIRVGTTGNNPEWHSRVYATGDAGEDYIELTNEGSVDGGADNDEIWIKGDGFHPSAYGGLGNDKIYIDGSPYQAILYGDRGYDEQTGGNDTLDASGSNISGAIIIGEGGDDLLAGTIYSDFIRGGEGLDWINGYGGQDDIIA